jgi:hypothetical protein
MELHGAAGHHRGDGMLVNHLTHGILEQYHELIERFDLSLQFDAIDQKDGYGDMFLAQNVKERVL